MKRYSQLKKFFSKNPACLICLFLILNIAFFINIFFFHSRVEFNKFNYEINAHLYFKDFRIGGDDFNLLRSLGQFDAQWYLKIAESGYPVNPKTPSLIDGGAMDGFTYAFFPLYPAIVGLFNVLVNNIELSAFIVSAIFLIMSFVSLIYVVNKHFNLRISVKASFLLFFYPFSVFLRSYFAEGVLLFLLIWFTYFLFEKRYFASSLLLSLINITKGTAFVLIAIFAYLVFIEFRKGKVTHYKLFALILLLIMPLVIWSLYNYINTGNPFYYLSTRPHGGVGLFTVIPFMSVFHNFALIFLFPLLPLHSFHFSQLDVLTVLVFLLLLIKGKKVLPPVYFWVSLALWLSPLLAKDLMSYSRYQSINFPIFIYLAHVLSGKRYILILSLFVVGLMITSLYFVNWWWVG
jgi:hypothetical protein